MSFRKSNGRFAKIQLRAQTQRRTIITGGIQTYTANMSQLVKGFEKLFSKETEIKRVINWKTKAKKTKKKNKIFQSKDKRIHFHLL